MKTETFYSHGEFPEEAITCFVNDGDMETDLDEAIKSYNKLKDIYAEAGMEFKAKLYKLEITTTEVQVSDDQR